MFNPVEAGPSHDLKLDFSDLDLFSGANDPSGYLEQVSIYTEDGLLALISSSDDPLVKSFDLDTQSIVLNIAGIVGSTYRRLPR